MANLRMIIGSCCKEVVGDIASQFISVVANDSHRGSAGPVVFCFQQEIDERLLDPLDPPKNP